MNLDQIIVHYLYFCFLNKEIRVIQFRPFSYFLSSYSYFFLFIEKGKIQTIAPIIGQLVFLLGLETGIHHPFTGINLGRLYSCLKDAAN